MERSSANAGSCDGRWRRRICLDRAASLPLPPENHLLPFKGGGVIGKVIACGQMPGIKSQLLGGEFEPDFF